MTHSGKNTEKEFKSHIREQAAEAVTRTMNGAPSINLDKFNQKSEFRDELDANFETWSLLEALKDDPELTKMAEKDVPSSAKSYSLKWFGYVVAAVIPLFAVLIAFIGLNPSGGQQQEYITQIQEQKTFRIEGSVITLNTQSKILVSFTKDTRTVELVYGEVLFEVAREPARPFYVVSGNNKVTVVGTTFNVKVDNSNMNVAVVEGKVAVEETSADSGKSMSTLLDAGKVSSSDGDVTTDIEVKVVDDISDYIDWQKGTLQFKNATLQEVVAKAQRYSKKKLILSPKVAEIEITTVFRIKSLENDLTAMKHVIPIKIESDQQSIAILPSD